MQSKKVLITRPVQEVDLLYEKLLGLGAVPLPFPTTVIQVDNEQLVRLEECIRELRDYDWLVFTSQNAVQLFWDRYKRVYADAGGLERICIAAVGPATAQALQTHGVRPEVVPEEYRGDAIAEKLGDVAEKRVLLPRAHGARAVLVDDLVRKGAIVEEVRLYRSETNSPEALNWSVLEMGIDFVTFTSASTVHGFFDLMGKRGTVFLSTTVPACIGPVTAASLREHGITEMLVAREYTIDGLLQVMLAYGKDRKESV